jgi:hypothetical protein
MDPGSSATGFASSATWPWPGAAAASVLPWPGLALARQDILGNDGELIIIAKCFLINYFI